MGAGGRWQNGVSTELRSARRIKLLPQGFGARPWILERRNGLARGVYNRWVEADRFSGKQIVAEARWCLNTLVYGGGYSAYKLVFGPNPVDLFSWGDTHEDLRFAQGASLSGQLVQRRKLRMMAREAALKEAANIEMGRLLAYNEAFNCTDVKIGDTALFYESTNKKSAPRRRGPAKILNIDDAGATVKFQLRTFKVARYCLRRQVEERDAEDEELDPFHARMRTVGSAP